MQGEIDLAALMNTMKPRLNSGEYVFCCMSDLTRISISEVVGIFKEEEAITAIVPKSLADTAGFSYSYVASWITLMVHSSLAAVGFTAAFSKALADENISCNVVAAVYHDHIFVPVRDAQKAMAVLNKLSKLKP